MILCIDTNTVVQALAEHHPFHPILDTWVAGHLAWAVSTPILLEYEEVLTRLSGPTRWRKLARLMGLPAMHAVSPILKTCQYCLAAPLYPLLRNQPIKALR